MTDEDATATVSWKLRVGRTLRPIRYRWRQRGRGVLAFTPVVWVLTMLRVVAARFGVAIRFGAPRSNVILYSSPWLFHPKGFILGFSRSYIRRSRARPLLRRHWKW